MSDELLIKSSPGVGDGSDRDKETSYADDTSPSLAENKRVP